MDFRACPEIAMADVQGVEPCDASMPSADLVALALQCAQYSRLSMDPNIQSEKAQGLSRIWMERSLRKKLAQGVLYHPSMITGVFLPQRGRILAAHGNAMGMVRYKPQSPEGALHDDALFGMDQAGSVALAGRF
jgi:hypothetical protein